MRTAVVAKTYHLAMNRLLIILMIVLLPLRAWAGDLMSVQMTTGARSMQATSAMPADCLMHNQAISDPASQGSSDWDVCTSCDLCIPMAELTSTRLDVAPYTAHVVPLMDDVEFLSAALTQTLRPPIS
jgi:hypothetical protein